MDSVAPNEKKASGTQGMEFIGREQGSKSET